VAFSKIMFIGNLGRDPEMRYTPNGKAVTSFTVAVNQGVKNQQTGEWTDETDWFSVSVWGDRGEKAAEKLRKGDKVFVDGRFKTRKYEARDGTTRTSLDVTADNVISLGTKPRDEEPSFEGAPVGGGRPQGLDEDLDDLPF
jgi:single-strand DNA-binding protein